MFHVFHSRNATFSYATTLERLFCEDSRVHDYICSCLSPQDLFALCATSRLIRSETKGYFRRAFSINKILLPFFDSPDRFRALQACTGTFISGSAALQYFDRTVYPEADLDLYVEHRYALEVIRFLLDEGYSFQARGNQLGNSAEDTFVKVLTKLLNYDRGSYLGRGIADVFDFTKGTRKVQVITAKETPLDIILTYHSTCVMSIITHEKAYSLFPRATFLERRSLVITTSGSGQDAAREKYVDRGWEMVKNTSDYDNTHPSSDFQAGDRWIGDPSTWTMVLTPELSLLEPDVISTNAWSLVYTLYDGPTLKYTVVNHSDLHHRITIISSERPVLQHVWDTIRKRPSSGLSKYDHQLCDGMYLMRHQTQ